jgi:HD superfamily phosphodiesterase
MTTFQMNFEDLTSRLSKFVFETCKHRDESHGHDHMKTVANISSIILTSYFGVNDKYKSLVAICAWLHDVNDHKYGNENEEVLNHFLELNFPEYKTLILDIIKRVSFSFEKKHGRDDWLDILGKEGLFIRNVVSDADKIEAININRCYLYEKMKNPEFDDKELWIRIIEHYNEKLVLLKDNYLYTDTAKTMAKPLHQKMVDKVAEIKAKYDI